MSARGVAGAWNASLFSDESAHNLAAARIIICAQSLWIVLSRDLPAISDLPALYWTFVPQSTRWRYLLFPGHAGLESLLQWLAVIALVLGMFGVATRVALLVAGLLLYHLAPLETIIWSEDAMERGLEISIMALVILSFAPCADAWTIAGQRGRAAERRGWEYRWPLLLIQLLVVEVYCLSGYHKLQHAGLAWASADNMRRWLVALSLWQPISVHTALARFIAARPILCTGLGFGTLTFELSTPLILFVRRLRAPWVLLALVMHIGIAFALNIVFLNTPQVLVFLDWGAIRDRAAAWRLRSRGYRAPVAGAIVPQP